MRTSAVLIVTLVACGGAKPSPPSSPAPEAPDSPTATGPAPAAPPASDPSTPLALPTSCADAASDVCTPAPAFVERLCEHGSQSAALALFGKAMPFTRLYLKGKVDELLFDEEVLALRFHGQPKGGIVVGSGAGSYEILRWDGTCSRAVEAEMITRTRPPRPKTARIVWHRIEDGMQNALLKSSEAVKKAHAARGRECKGAMTGDVTASCEKADAALVAAVADYVRSGGALPPTAL